METASDAAKLISSDVDDLIGYQLRLAQIASYRTFEGSLDRYGIAPRYLGLLAIIGSHPKQPQSRLAEAISLSRSTLVAISDRLEQDGLVRRGGSPGDRRVKVVELTPDGQRVVQELIARSKRHEEQLAKGMSQEERSTLVRLLRTMCSNLETIR